MTDRPIMQLKTRHKLVDAIKSVSFVWIVLAALTLSSLSMLFAGFNPLKAYAAIFEGAYGSMYQFSVTVRLFIPMCLAGLAVAIPLRCYVFNIGAEGQLIMGAVAATFVALNFDAPFYIHIPLALLAAAIGGAFWGMIPGLLLAFRNVNDVLSTVMLNFIAIFVVQYLVRGPWASSDAMFPVTEKFPETVQFSQFGTTLAWNSGIFVTLLGLLAALIIIYRTNFGFAMKILASGKDVATNIGLSIKLVITGSLATGGAFAGLAGATEVMGVQHNLSPQFSPGYGFDAVMIAMLSGGHPLRICIVAFFFASLRNGVGFMQRVEHIPSAIGQIIIALLVIFFAVDVARKQLKAMKI